MCLESVLLPTVPTAFYKWKQALAVMSRTGEETFNTGSCLNEQLHADCIIMLNAKHLEAKCRR